MLTVIIRDKATNNYIGEAEVKKESLRTLEQDFIIIQK